MEEYQCHDASGVTDEVKREHGRRAERRATMLCYLVHRDERAREATANPPFS